MGGGPDRAPHRRGQLYLCAINDLFSNRIVGWAIDERMKARLVVAAIDMAVARRGEVAGCILRCIRAHTCSPRALQLRATRFGARQRLAGFTLGPGGRSDAVRMTGNGNATWPAVAGDAVVFASDRYQPIRRARDPGVYLLDAPPGT